jgi:putative flippase GtrA
MNKTIIQFFKFGIVGFSNTAISYLIYLILVYIGSHYIVANVIAFFISVLNSFFWNNKYVFKNNNDQKRNIIHSLIKTYISYAFSGIFIGSLLLFLFIDVLHISKYIAPFFGLVITIPLNFILNKKWAFKSVQENKDKQNEENQRFNTML